MSDNFKRIYYEDFTGFYVHHTWGDDASSSTVGYLHYDTDSFFMYFKKGSGKIKIEGHHHVIEEGDIVLLNPSELYLCSVDKNVEHERISLCFNENFAKNFNGDISELLSAFCKRKKGEGNFIKSKMVKELHIDSLFEECVLYAKSPLASGRVMAACKFLETMTVLSRTLSDSRDDKVHRDSLTEKILDYINEHFTEDISITDISENFYMDKYNFCHYFKKQVGVSAWNYIIFRRLNFCNELIKQNVSIDEASYKAGFRNYSNFFRLYKKYMRMTPMEFKKLTE